MGEARYTLTEADVVTGARLSLLVAWRRSVMARMVGILWSLWTALIVGVALYQGAPIDWAMIGGAAIGAVLFVPLMVGLGYMLAPRRARRAFRQQRTLHGEHVLRWDDAAVEITSAIGQARLPWSVFHGWTLGRHSLLLWQSERMMNLLPLRALGEADADAMIGRLRAAGVAEKRPFGG